MKHSRRYTDNVAKIDRIKEYELDDAVVKVKETANAKFDESVEIALNLGVDPRRADQMIRGTVALPHGTGKSIRVLVFAKGPKQEEAREAGADHVGLEDYMEKIQAGWTDVDAIIATPDVMATISKLGRVLGPRGLMPNPKSGTVTFEVGQAVKEVKAGRIDFRTDKYGILHVAIGKASFETVKIKENLLEFMRVVMRMKPTTAKGLYLKNVSLSSTLGPGIKVSKQSITNAMK
ncbi:MAG: 50S ribosomal protein L1 [bacterium]|nr:50S ribosomal protein L1 [bacterium]